MQVTSEISSRILWEKILERNYLQDLVVDRGKYKVGLQENETGRYEPDSIDLS